MFSSSSYNEYEKKSIDLFICEGFIDFASILNYEQNVLGLTSKNVGSDFLPRLEEEIKEFGTIQRIFLAADRDVYTEDLKKSSGLIKILKEYSQLNNYEFYIIATKDLENYGDYEPKDFNDIVKYYKGDYDDIEDVWLYLKEKAIERDLDLFLSEYSQIKSETINDNELTILDSDIFADFYCKYKIVNIR